MPALLLHLCPQFRPAIRFSVFLCFGLCTLILGFWPLAAAQPPLFRDATAEAGLQFQHFTGATGEFYMPEIMGAGGALFDYDGDGDLDVYLIQGTLLDEKKKLSEARFPPPANWQPGHRLLRNELIPSGKLRFTDVTEKAGVGHVGFGMGVATGDIENDGDVDLYVTNFGSNVLYRNNGDGTFNDVTAQAGVDDPRWSTSAAFFDYDRDGDLDLYVANYVDFTVKSHKRCTAPTGELDYCTPAAYRPVADRLFRNEGQGRFTDVSQASGIGSLQGPGLGVTCADFNDDGWPDVYVANDGAANWLWLNQGNGKFVESGLLAGAAYSVDGMARAGMGIAAGDYDNDGDEDVLVTNLTREGSTLYRNLSDKGQRGTFADASQETNMARPTFLSTGFGVGWFDYDNDGWLDLFAANGAVTLMPTQRSTPYPFSQRNQLFHNEGVAKGFREVSPTAGPAFQRADVSRGAAFGDVDNDGDIDLLIANNNGPARLLLNEASNKQHWLSVRLVGVKANRDGIGAQVTVYRSGQPPLRRRAHTDGSYLSARDRRVHFGLGSTTELEAIEVQWPGGARERWLKPRLDRELTLREQSGQPVPLKSQ